MRNFNDLTLDEKLYTLWQGYSVLTEHVDTQSKGIAEALTFLAKQVQSMRGCMPVTISRSEGDALLRLFEHLGYSPNDAPAHIPDEEPVSKPEPKQGYIYFVFSPDASRIKIGYTTDPNKRLESLLTSSPSPLETLKVIEGTLAQERQLHARFSHLRVHREWFTDCPELREYIASL